MRETLKNGFKVASINRDPIYMYMTDAHMLSVVSEKKGVKENGEGENDDDGTNDNVSNGIALQRTGSSLAHIGQWGVEYTDITVSRNIQRAMSRNPNKS